MSDQNPAGAPAPAAPPTTPASPPAPPAPPAPQVDPNKPPWLDDRLARAEKSARDALLADLGVTDQAAAKAAIAAAKAAADASKTAEQRAADATAEAAQQRREAERLLAITTEHASRMMFVLTAEQQKAVKDIAGDDPAAQLRAIGVLGPTWAKDAAATAATAPAAPVAPVTTGPGANAPAGAAPGSPPDHRAVYTTMRETNPFAAAAYGLSNPAAYDRK